MSPRGGCAVPPGTPEASRSFHWTHWGLGMVAGSLAGGLPDRLDALCFAAPISFHPVRRSFGV